MNPWLTPSFAPAAPRLSAAFGRWLMESSPAQPAPARDRVFWRAPTDLPAAPGPAEVLPSLPSKRLKIVCLPAGETAKLPQRVQATCAEQAELGLKLSSTFCHDRSLFLVFKRL